jgi:hypothetical protein
MIPGYYKKCGAFVDHIQNHLAKGHIGSKGCMITPNKVGCTICGLDIDQIYKQLMENEAKAELIGQLLDAGIKSELFRAKYAEEQQPAAEKRK